MTSCRSCTDAHGNVVACTNVYRIVKDQAQIAVTIKRSKTLYRHDQDRILDDQDFDPGRGRFHRRVLGDYPLLCEMLSCDAYVVSPSHVTLCMYIS